MLFPGWRPLSRTAIDVHSLGPQVGERVDLVCQTDRIAQSIWGQTVPCCYFIVRLIGDPIAKRNSWSCRTDKELTEAGVGVAAISYDSESKTLAVFAERRGVHPLLSDDESAVIKEYGILNTVVAEGLNDADDPGSKYSSLCSCRGI